MKALILVDIQNDFCPLGALAVPGGDEVVGPANELATCFKLVVATQDWHPADHGSFAANHAGGEIGKVVDLNGLQQILWPTHCVQGTSGADFHPDLDLSKVTEVFRKGTSANVDSYSGLYDNGHRNSTGLAEYLKENGVHEVFVCGLATDYCVKFTVLDALTEGFEVSLVEDASRGVELSPGDVDKAIEDMRQAGASIVSTSQAIQSIKD